MKKNSKGDFTYETKKAVYFWTPRFHRLDNFSAHTVRIWGKKFPTLEHAYQWRKFWKSAPKVAKEIFLAGSPNMAKRIANKYKDKIPVAWFKGEREKVMERLMRAKLRQHKDVQEKLKMTGNRKIIENSPLDDYWGIGPDGKGQNMTGKIWMKIRKNYK